MRRNQSGFTLIEIVVVVMIIGILSSIAVVNFNKVRDKAEAARIATQFHYLEDAVIAAIIAGASQADLKSITASDVATSVLSDYVTEANMTDIPDGMSIDISATQDTGGGVEHFAVWIAINSDASHAGILNELQAMFPRTLNRMGDYEWVQVDSRDLAVEEITPTP